VTPHQLPHLLERNGGKQTNEGEREYKGRARGLPEPSSTTIPSPLARPRPYTPARSGRTDGRRPAQEDHLPGRHRVPGRLERGQASAALGNSSIEVRHDHRHARPAVEPHRHHPMLVTIIICVTVLPGEPIWIAGTYHQGGDDG
jgi:hypothetical protein